VELQAGLEQRLAALRAEASAGRRRLAELQAEQDRLLDALVRIDVAIRILADEGAGNGGT
jgi:hypothetical protein